MQECVEQGRGVREHLKDAVCIAGGSKVHETPAPGPKSIKLLNCARGAIRLNGVRVVAVRVVAVRIVAGVVGSDGRPLVVYAC